VWVSGVLIDFNEMGVHLDESLGTAFSIIVVLLL
jgi:hypothetical protein